MKNITFNIIKSLLLAIIIIYAPSCTDEFLEKPPSVDITVDSVYNNMINADKALADAYRGIPYTFPYDWDNRNSVYAALFDELSDIATEREVSWGGALNWYRGNISINNYITPAGSDDQRAKEQWFPDYYVNIRRALLVAENIDRVPGADAAYKKRVKGEARMIAALNYYHMFKNYGSVPFVGHVVGVNEDIYAPRRPLNVFVDSLLNMLNQCAEDLPTAIPPMNQYGRLTKAAALGTIAKVYWYSASPLFNSSTPAYSYPASDPNKQSHDSLISFMKEDPNLWIKAADACKAAIDEAERAGFSLLATGDYGNDFNNDYYNLFTSNERGRPETIIASHIYYWDRPHTETWDVFYYFFRPSGWKKGVITHNLVEMYDMKETGLPQDNPNSGYNPRKPYSGLDPRFYETIVYHGCRYSGNEYRFDTESSFWINNSGRSTGYLMKKFHPRDASERNLQFQPILRLADLYLMYAECLNEAYGPTHDAIYEYIGKVRARAGMPNIPRYSSKEELREKILTERAVELALEDSRYYDLRRWKRDDLYQTTIWGVEITDNNDGFLDIKKFDYPLTTLGQRRVWKDFWYLFPFPRAEVMKGYGLVQNPGWDDDNIEAISR